MKADFEPYRAGKAALVERFLDTYLPRDDEPPQSLNRAVRYSLFAGGKRLRPVLVLAAAEAVGGSEEQAMPGAAALELIHTYSLIHDDLPAMDNDSLRRGKPTSHVVFGEAIAILAGDALQTHAFDVLASSPFGNGSDEGRLRLKATSILARATGSRGMVGGQVVDLEAEGREVDAETLDFIHRHKTGALMSAAAEMGAVLGGGSDSQLERLACYGRELGLAFQVIDDILDVEGDEVALGKSKGKDEKAGKATYPRVHGMEEARLRARHLAESAASQLEPFGARAEPLIALARRTVERDF